MRKFIETTGRSEEDAIAAALFQLQKLNGEAWEAVGEAVPFSAFVNNAYTFENLEEGTYRVVEADAAVDGYYLVTTYSENAVLTQSQDEMGNTAVSDGALSVTNTYTEKYQPIHTAGSIVVTKTANGAETIIQRTTFQTAEIPN